MVRAPSFHEGEGEARFDSKPPHHQPKGNAMPSTVARQQAIIRAANAAGIDPSVALAIAERESNFNPRAHSSKTIYGMYQMRGDLRAKYGVGNSDDPDVQARGWTRFFRDTKAQMAAQLGRAPTDAEAYLGHHFGAGRAGRMMRMDPRTPVQTVFTPYEMSINPHFGRAGTVGNLDGSVINDIGRRARRYGGAELPDFSSMGDAVGDAGLGASAPPDLSSFGSPVGGGGAASASAAPPATPQPTATIAQPSVKQTAGAPDFSQFGTPVL